MPGIFFLFFLIYKFDENGVIQLVWPGEISAIYPIPGKSGHADIEFTVTAPPSTIRHTFKAIDIDGYVGDYAKLQKGYRIPDELLKFGRSYKP